jgi:hypothetical protein
MLSRALQDNFEDDVGMYQDFNAQIKTHNNDNHNINLVSGFQGGGGGSSNHQGSGGGNDSGKEVRWKHGEGFRGGKGKGGSFQKRKHSSNAEVKGWLYSPNEYAQLNPAQKQKLKSLRTPRDGLLLDNRQTAQLVARISALKAALLQAETHEDDQESEPGASNANCNHSTLKCPKRK